MGSHLRAAIKSPRASSRRLDRNDCPTFPPRPQQYPRSDIVHRWGLRFGFETRSKVFFALYFCPVFCPVFFCTGPDKANTGENRRRFGDLFSPVFARYFRSRRPAKLVKRGGRQRHRPSIRPPPPLKAWPQTCYRGFAHRAIPYLTSPMCDGFAVKASP